MVKVMLTLAQNFSDQGSVERVLGMLQDVLGECHQALADAHQDEEDQVAAHANFMNVCQQTVEQCNQRITENTAELGKTNDQITETTKFRETRTEDLGDAQDDDAAETERWNNETSIHDRLLSELDDQLGAIMEIVEIITTTAVSDTVLERMNA
jgi:chromosome segregation ATPase